MDPRKDAIGVHAAHELIDSQFDLLAASDVKVICVAVIGRYDQSKLASELTVHASTMLRNLEGGFIFRVSWLKKMCAYLIGRGDG